MIETTTVVDLPEVVPTVSSRTLAPTYIGRVINKWLYLVPFADICASSGPSADSGFEQYVRNAETQVTEVFRQCRGFTDWPREAVSHCQLAGSDRDSSDSRVEADATGEKFYEGEFFAVLFDMVETLLDQDYAQNLQASCFP